MTLVALALLAHGRDSKGRPLYVVTRRGAGVHLAGAWEFPGGKVEDGEAPAEALRRELAEELGVTLDGDPVPASFAWHRYPERTVLLLLFDATVAAGSAPPQPLAAQEMRVVPLAELLQMELPPANAPLVAHLRQRLEEPTALE